MRKIIKDLNQLYDNGYILTKTYNYARLLSCKETHRSEYGECQSHAVTIRALTLADAVHCISENFTLYPCGHIHDCCGCWQSHILDVRQTKKKEFFFTVHSHKNI